jgi:ParB/RepB/Spo0J family partition protein
VRPVGSFYEVVFGNHRLEACKHLGWRTIPAVIKRMSDDESFLVKVVENLQRNIEINAVAEAKGYITLIDHGWTINMIAAKIGKSDSYVSDRVGLIRRLHPSIAGRVANNDNSSRLKPSHAELLARVRSKRYQLELSCLVEKKGLSVRKLETMIRGGQPLRVRLERRGDSLYVPLPEDIVRHFGFEGGESLYIYLQSRKRVVVERVPFAQEPVQPILSRRLATVPIAS